MPYQSSVPTAKIITKALLHIVCHRFCKPLRFGGIQNLYRGERSGPAHQQLHMSQGLDSDAELNTSFGLDSEGELFRLLEPISQRGDDSEGM